MNVLLSRLDEQQRRWYAALEANRMGHGGDHLIWLFAKFEANVKIRSYGGVGALRAWLEHFS
jgi:hypothetical protein